MREEASGPWVRGSPPACLAGLLLIAFLFAGSVPHARAELAFRGLEFRLEDKDGSAAALAGSHPFAWRTTVLFATGDEEPGPLRDLEIKVPPGLVGAPHLVPRCGHTEFIAGGCPDAAALGTLSVLSRNFLPEGAERVLVQAPVYNLAPLPGSAAELGAFLKAGELGAPLIIAVGISPAYPNRLTASLTNVSQVAPVYGYQLILWGNPSDAAHDPYRGECAAEFSPGLNGFEPLSNGSCPYLSSESAPLLTLPTSCAAGAADFLARAWTASSPSIPASLPEALRPIGCSTLSYVPELALRPTTGAATAPSGLDIDLATPDPALGSATGRAAATTSTATLVLPPGMTINPAALNGLQACTRSQLAAELPDLDLSTGCPEAAKVGTAMASTPLFAGPIAGSIYLAAPHDNSFDSLLALYLILREPERGVLLRLPIRLEADPATGRLTASFEQIPPLPLNRLSLRFSAGPRAPLATPPGCGSHAIDYSLAPSSGNPPLSGTWSFATTSNCPTSFAPGFAAGTTSFAAGTAAPFVLELTNQATSPNLGALRLTLPPGIVANLTGPTSCPEADVLEATCPAASRVGYVRLALGVGPEPLWVPESAEASAVYLAGPYRGAPYSLLLSIPAAAGPYDLGTVVRRAPVEIDPLTAQASLALPDLPQIFRGIPLRYRAIRLVLDRPGFIRNPTSCGPMRIAATVTAAGGDSAALSERFQVADCAALPFRPRLGVRFAGALARNGRPALRAVIRPGPGQANLSRAALTLPRAELLEYQNIRSVCDASLYAAGSGGGERCPSGSRYGRARVFTPLFDRPLEGPLYLRTNGDPHRLPDLVASLTGAGIHLDFVAHINSTHGLLHLAFDGLPDVSMEKVTLQLPGGRRGLLVNTADLCRTRPRASAVFLAHNRKRRSLHRAVKLECGARNAAGPAPVHPTPAGPPAR